MSSPLIYRLLHCRRPDVFRNLSELRFKTDEKTFAASEVSGFKCRLQWPGGYKYINGPFCRRVRFYP